MPTRSVPNNCVCVCWKLLIEPQEGVYNNYWCAFTLASAGNSRGVGNITHSSLLDNISNQEALDSLVLGDTTTAVGASDRGGVATAVLWATSITSLGGHCATLDEEIRGREMEREGGISGLVKAGRPISRRAKTARRYVITRHQQHSRLPHQRELFLNNEIRSLLEEGRGEEAAVGATLDCSRCQN